MNEPEGERRAEWAPVIPVGFVTFLIGVFVWPVVAVAWVVSLVALVVRARRGLWTARTFSYLGVVAGGLLLAVFLTLTDLTGGFR